MSKLKTIDANTKEFEANGKKYFIESSISFDRFLMYQMLQLELGIGISFSDMVKLLQDILKLCDKEGCHKGTIAVMISNSLTAISDIGSRRIKAIEMCSLFINTENEDRKVITDEMIKSKQKDWFDVEGMDVNPFFLIAMDSIKDYRKIYNEIILNSSEA